MDLKNLTQNLLKNADDKINILQSSVSQFLNQDPCLENPCLNGGTCVRGQNNTLSCLCSIYFAGTRCGSGSDLRKSIVY